MLHSLGRNPFRSAEDERLQLRIRRLAYEEVPDPEARCRADFLHGAAHEALNQHAPLTALRNRE